MTSLDPTAERRPEPPEPRLLNTPLGWTGGARAMLLLALALPPLVLGFMLSNAAAGSPAWASFADTHGVTMLSVAIGALILVDISLLILGTVLRGDPSEKVWYQLVTALFLAAAPLVAGIFLGLHINGLLALLMIGSALCLLLLERWVALVNIGAWVLGVLALTLVEQAGLMEHALALATVPAGPGGLHRGWLLGPGLITLLGGLVGLLALDQVASRERSYRHELHAHAHRDPLSGLPDLQVFQRAIGREIDRAARYRIPLCVAIIALDNLEAINRTLGYEAGDAMLRQIAERLQRGLRESDMAAGMGDGRFALLLPHLASEQVGGTVTRIIGLLNDEPIGEARSSINVHARLGLAIWEPGLDSLALLARASEALQETKTSRDALAAVYGQHPEESS
jgi:diguanylate cyclase (GGDEF)-like protein